MKTWALVLLTLPLGACAQATVLRPPASPEVTARFNRNASGQVVAVERVDGGKLRVSSPRMDERALAWYDSATHQRIVAPLADLRELRLRNPVVARAGMTAGGLAGLALALVWAGTACSTGCSVPPALVVLPSFLLGAIIGATAGQERLIIAPAGEATRRGERAATTRIRWAGSPSPRWVSGSDSAAAGNTLVAPGRASRRP